MGTGSCPRVARCGLQAVDVGPQYYLRRRAAESQIRGFSQKQRCLRRTVPVAEGSLRHIRRWGPIRLDEVGAVALWPGKWGQRGTSVTDALKSCSSTDRFLALVDHQNTVQSNVSDGFGALGCRLLVLYGLSCERQVSHSSRSAPPSTARAGD